MSEHSWETNVYPFIRHLRITDQNPFYPFNNYPLLEVLDNTPFDITYHIDPDNDEVLIKPVFNSSLLSPGEKPPTLNNCISSIKLTQKAGEYYAHSNLSIILNNLFSPPFYEIDLNEDIEETASKKDYCFKIRLKPWQTIEEFALFIFYFCPGKTQKTHDYFAEINLKDLSFEDYMELTEAEKINPRLSLETILP